MSPSPKNTKNQQLAAGEAEGVRSGGTASGLGIEARVKALTWEVGVAAVIQDFAQGEVILLLNDSIAAGTHVSVQVDTFSFAGEVMFCKLRDARWETHVSFDDVDAMGMRRAPRLPVRIRARLFTGTSDGPITATIVDVSGAGMGIELGQPMQVESNIVVQSEEAIGLGVVKHCRQVTPGVFRAGVQLHHIVEKDPDLVKAAEEAGWKSWLGVRLGRRK